MATSLLIPFLITTLFLAIICIGILFFYLAKSRRLISENREHCRDFEKIISDHKQVQEALRQSERRASALLGAIPDMVFQLDNQGIYLDYKADSADLYAQSVDTIIGKKNRDMMPADFADLVDDKISQTLTSGKMTTFEYQLEMVGKGITDYEARMTKSGENQVTTIVRNVTELKQARKDLQNANEELENRVAERTLELQKSHNQLLHGEKLAAIGRLSASITHELSNPLHGVMAVLKGLQRRGVSDEEDSGLIDMSVTECVRMKNLIKSLQSFNKPSSGRVASVNIHELIDNILLLGKSQYKSKKINIKTNYAPDMIPIMGIIDQLKQVILNLLNNAVYACDGSGTITIRTAVISQNRITIEIEDTGKGIESAHLDKIFDPFFTTKTEKEGSGLGLSISYGIIKKHGGRIDFENKSDRGAIFTLTLPITGITNA